MANTQYIQIQVSDLMPLGPFVYRFIIIYIANLICLFIFCLFKSFLLIFMFFLQQCSYNPLYIPSNPFNLKLLNLNYWLITMKKHFPFISLFCRCFYIFVGLKLVNLKYLDLYLKDIPWPHVQNTIDFIPLYLKSVMSISAVHKHTGFWLLMWNRCISMCVRNFSDFSSRKNEGLKCSIIIVDWGKPYYRMFG